MIKLARLAGALAGYLFSYSLFLVNIYIAIYIMRWIGVNI